MKPKPLHGFTPADLRAFGEGNKTQWRVPVKPTLGPEAHWAEFEGAYRANGLLGDIPNEWRSKTLFCPLGKPGDRLFVTETWQPAINGDTRERVGIYREQWAANGSPDGPRGGTWRSPRTMPAWAARYWCEIVAVRVERIQSITGMDCKAEGFEPDWEAFHDATCNMEGWEEPEEFIEECEEECDWINFGRTLVVSSEHREWDRDRTIYALRLAYKDAWNARHGAGAWERNDWCWCLTLKKVEGAK